MIVAAQRAKPKKVLDHIEVYSQRGGGVVIRRSFTDAAHEPEIAISGGRSQRPKAVHSHAVAASSDAVRIAPRNDDPLARRTQNAGSVATLPQWQRKGLFKPGFTQGPRIKGAKLHTKGKI